MTDFITLKNEVLSAAGNRSDDDAVTWAGRGINAAILAAAMQFEPPELRTSGSLTALSGQDYIEMTTLTRLLRIEEVYNSTGACRVWPLRYNMRGILWLPTTGYVKYYSEYGNTMYFNPTPSEDNTLAVNYLQYPARLTEDTDSYPFATLEDFVIALGSAITFAFLEESESSNTWLSMAGKLGVPESVISIVRRFMKGEISDDNIQRAIQQSSTST